MYVTAFLPLSETGLLGLLDSDVTLACFLAYLRWQCLHCEHKFLICAVSKMVYWQQGDDKQDTSLKGSKLKEAKLEAKSPTPNGSGIDENA